MPSVSYKAALATVSTRSFLRASETLRRQATNRLPKELEAIALQQIQFALVCRLKCMMEMYINTEQTLECVMT